MSKLVQFDGELHELEDFFQSLDPLVHVFDEISQVWSSSAFRNGFLSYVPA